VRNIEENARNCNADINIVQSDLFDNLDPGNFDFIIINPPYYPKNPITESENAWYCGDDFQYFRRLFPQLKSRTKPSVNIYMIVSEDCEIDKIVNVANQNSFKFEGRKELYI
jgi:release factor glutamine methyltransferase